MPKVSVIMGIYNCENTLSEAIDSILKQTYTDWELIMCDDGSTDNTYEIAMQYSDKYNNIVLLKNEKNMRLAYSLNRCLEVSNGEYIARMDADDISLPERLEKEVYFLDKHLEYEMVSSAAIIFDENGDKMIRGLGKTEPLKNGYGGFIHPTVMIRKKAYDGVGGYSVSKETLRAEDVDLWFKFKLKKYSGYVIQEPLIRYRENNSDFKKRTIKAAIGSMKLHYKYYKLLKVPLKQYLYVLRPLIVSIIPKKIICYYHSKK